MLIKLILENYIPLLSSGITKIELDLEHMVNLFIAQNGVGKTSILAEANPNPPENGNYRAGGRKYFEWKANGKHYVLDSKTGLGDGHSFILNGEQLNKGGTYTAQKELVLAHFRLDNNRNKVLSGLKLIDLFSNMSPNRRKEVLMWLYPNNTDYAMKVYNDLKAGRNELKAAIKNQVLRYTEENKKLEQIAECGVDEMESRIRAIDDELRQSLLVRGSLEQVKLDPELQRKVNQFNQLTEQLAVNKVSGFFDTEAEIQEALSITQDLHTACKEQMSVLQQVISEHAGALQGLEEFLEDPLIYQHQSEQLQVELDHIEEKINQYDVQLEQYPLFNDKEMILTGLELVYDAFVAQLHRVTLASTPELTGGMYNQFKKRFEVLANDIREQQGKLTGVNHQLKHYDNLELVNCPDCSHEFKVGVSAGEIGKLRLTQSSLATQLTRLEDEHNTLRDKIDNDAEWYESMLALHAFCSFNSDVQCLPILVKTYNIGKEDATTLLNALRAYKGRLEQVTRRKSLLEEKDLLNTRIGLLQRDNVLDIAVYVQNLEVDLHKKSARVGYYQRRINQLTSNLLTIQDYHQDLARLHQLKEEVLQGLEAQGLLQLRKRVDERISLLTDEKDDYLRDIIKSRSLNAVVSSISEDIDRLKRRLVIVETWMNGLCPNKGLIGRLMGDFLKIFCGNMNAVIQSVWNTPLYVKPCNKDNGDLTYKFPVVNGDRDPAPDISNCSRGQAEIIDFAFRYTALSYHGQGYPLIMDEVGTTFDEIKRGRFFNFVKEISQKKDARQLLMVSHYINQIGMFVNPNIVAMKHDGLTLPGEANKHSIIT